MSEEMAIQYVDILENKLAETGARLLLAMVQRDELVAAGEQLMRAYGDCDCEMCKRMVAAIEAAKAQWL